MYKYIYIVYNHLLKDINNYDQQRFWADMGRWLRCSRSGALRTDVHLSEIQKVFTKRYPKGSQGGLLFSEVGFLVFVPESENTRKVRKKRSCTKQERVGIRDFCIE